jgi:hypothetical protein
VGFEYGDDGGPVFFALPETGDASETRLTWSGGEWTPGETVRERLSAPLPSFDVTLTGPDTAGPGDDPKLALSVTNTGDIGGWYALGLNRIGPRIAYTPVGRIAGSLESGQSTTHTVDATSPTDGLPVRYLLDAPGSDSDTEHVIEPTDVATPTPDGTESPAASTDGPS